MVGSGILNDPYLITNASDWADINTYQGTRVYFKLVNDIDFNNQLITPLKNFMGYIDGNYKRIKYFKVNNDTTNTGIFDTINGDVVNYSIKDLEIYSGSLEYSFGIENFGFVSGLINSASIKNVHVVHCKEFNGNISISTDFNFGFFAGKVIDSNIISSSVRNSEFDMTNISTYNGSDSFGGFVGKIDNSVVNTCYSDNRFYNIVTSSIDNINIGGFVGYVTGSHSEILNCHTSASIHMIYWNSITKVGGFVGNVQECELFENCYSNTWMSTNASPISYVNGFVGYSVDDNYNNCFYNMDRVPGGFNTSYVVISGRSDKQSNSIVRLPDSEMKLLENYTEIDNYYLNFVGDQALGFIQTGLLTDPYFDGDNLDSWIKESVNITFQNVEPGTNGNYCVYYNHSGIANGMYLDLTSIMITGEYYIVKMRYKSTGHFNVQTIAGTIYKTFTPKGDWTYIEFRILATDSKNIYLKFLDTAHYWIDSFYVEYDRNVDFNSVELIDSNVYNKVLELNGNDEYLYAENQPDLAGFDITNLTGTQLPTSYYLNGSSTSIISLTEDGSLKCMKVTSSGIGGLALPTPLSSYKSYKVRVRYKSNIVLNFWQWNANSQLYYTFPITTEWNDISFNILSQNVVGSIIYFRVDVAGIYYIDTFEIYEDVKNELNSHKELIKHSKNRNFETALRSNITTNSGYEGTTDWVDTNNDGLADTYTDQHMLEFDGVDDYLQISVPNNLLINGTFETGDNTDVWSKNIDTTFNDTELGKTGNYCCKVYNSSGLAYISKLGILTIGKKYKLRFRYKANADFSFRHGVNGTSINVFTSTTQWNEVYYTFTATDTGIGFQIESTKTIWIDDISITPDWQLDLNESYELIKHSINRDFELITSASASITPLSEYAIQFNGSDEYLFRSMPANLLSDGGFTTGTNTDNLVSEGLSTDFANLEFGRTGIYCLKITGNTSSSYKKIYKSILTVGKKYKAKFRYKSNISVFVGTVDGETYFPITTQWNTVECTFVATTPYFRIGFYGDTTHYAFIDDVEIKEDWKLDLNESYELIKHSMNRDYELAYSASLITNTGYTETTDWINPDTYGVASGITPREDYALEFDGSTEYLQIGLPSELITNGTFEIDVTNWSGAGTWTQDTETGKQGNFCAKFIYSNQGRTPTLTAPIVIGQKYKVKIYYKSTGDIQFRSGVTTVYTLPATSEWNYSSFIFTAVATDVVIVGMGSGTAFFDNISMKVDQGFDLNRDQEMILHSKNWDFERSISTTDYMLNTGWTGTTDWSGSVDGLAAGIVSREDYALEFDGTSEYLGIPLPADLAPFNPATISGGNPPTNWAKYDPSTVTYDTTQSGSYGAMKLEGTGSQAGIVSDYLLVSGKKYKITMRYKSTSGLVFGAFTLNNSYYGGTDATSEWNTITRVITAHPTSNHKFWIWSLTVGGIFWIESITIKEDQGFDLNKDQEMILHSKNWNFETALKPSYISNFTAGVDGFTSVGNVTASFNQTIDGVSGCLKLTCTSGSTSNFAIKSSVFYPGKRYKYKASVYVPTSSVNIANIGIYNGYAPTFQFVTKGQWITKEVEFTHFPTESPTNLWIGINNSATKSADDVVYVKDIMIYELNNMVANPTCAGTYSSGLAPNWNYAGVGITYSEGVGYSGGKAQLFTASVDMISGNIRALTSISYQAGKQYKLSFRCKITTPGTGNTIKFGLSSVWQTVVVDASWGSYTYNITPTVTDNAIFFGASGSGQTTTYAIDDVSLNEIPEWTYTGNHTCNTSIIDKYVATQSLLITSTASGSSTNCVILPSGSFEQCVSGKKYTLEGFAKVEPTSLTYGSNLLSGDGTSGWTAGYGTGGVTGSEYVLASTTTGYITRTVTTANKFLKVVFKAKSSTYSGSMRVYHNQANAPYVGTTPNVTSDWQTFTTYVNSWPTIQTFYIQLSSTHVGDVYLDDISIQESDMVNLTSLIGTKMNSTSTLTFSTWTKFVSNFEATSNEVNKNLQMWLSNSGSVYVDNVSLTQAYDIISINKHKQTNIVDVKRIYDTGTIAFVQVNNNAYIGYSSQIYQYGNNGTFLNTFQNLMGVLDRTSTTFKTYQNGSLSAGSFAGNPSTIGKSIGGISSVLFGKDGGNYFSGQISHIQLIRFENINQSTFNTASVGLQFPVGGGAEEVLRLTFQNPNSISGMLKDYSPKNHNVVPSGSIDLTNRKRVYEPVPATISIEDTTNKIFWLNPDKISTTGIDQWKPDYPTGSANYFWNAPSSTAPETSSLNSIGVYTPTGTNYMRLTDASGYRFIPSGSNWTMFSVLKNSAGPAISKYDGGTNKLFWVGTSTALRFMIRDSAANDLDILTTTNATNWQLLVTTYDNSTKTLNAYVSGSSYTDTNASYINEGWEMVGARLFLNGQNNGTTATSFGTGTGIAEIVITTDKKSTSDINSIARGLANKYGLTWTNI